MDRFEALSRTLSRRCPGLELREREPMSRHTTFRIGGPAALMALPKTQEEAQRAVETAAELGIEPYFLGSGSNLLVSDEGVECFLIKTVDGLDRLERGDGGRIEVGSGVLLAKLARFAQENGLAGLEFAGGIPGSLGGGVTMNAGAYGGELDQMVESVTCIGPNGAVETVAAGECAFGYRTSAFSDGRRLILGATLKLAQDNPEVIRARMADLAERRREKQPLEYPSAGSAFKRPAPVDGKPRYAAALIDRCGLKGLTVGGAQVSEKHAGFIINRGGATCADVLALMELVRERVLTQTGILLEAEIKLLQ